MSSFASYAACAESFHSSLPEGEPQAGVLGYDKVDGVDDDSHLFQDEETIEAWTAECLANNNVLLPTMSAQEYKDAMYAFGQKKYTEYLMRHLTAGAAAGRHVGEVLRHCVLSSMYFEEQQNKFAKQFVAVVCRRIVELSVAYGN